MKIRRKLLFASLYLSEGAPIGFLWLALPTQLRAAGVAIESITALTAALVLPWTLKFFWAPLIDLLQGRRWGLRHWIVTAQTVMGLTLLPLLILDPVRDFRALFGFLIGHAVAAATQDVAIDALCISTTPAEERGEINGWMQTGMLLGRSMLGGGALILAPWLGWSAVVGVLIAVTMFSAVLVLRMETSEQPTVDADKIDPAEVKRDETAQTPSTFSAVITALREVNTWVGLAFALTGGACFKALEVLYGPLLIDRGFTKTEVGSFAALPMISLMIAGSILGGRMSDRFGRKSLVAGVLVLICVAVSGLAVLDRLADLHRSPMLLGCLGVAAFGIGVFTAASYAMFMDLTHPVVAATQFSAFMGMTNGCEAWSTWWAGRIIGSVDCGYSEALLILCGISLLSLGLLPLFRRVDWFPAVVSVQSNSQADTAVANSRKNSATKS